MQLVVCSRTGNKLSHVLDRDGEGGAFRLDAGVRHELPVQVEGVRSGDGLVENLTPLSSNQVSTALHTSLGEQTSLQVSVVKRSHDAQALNKGLD